MISPENVKLVDELISSYKHLKEIDGLTEQGKSYLAGLEKARELIFK